MRFSEFAHWLDGYFDLRADDHIFTQDQMEIISERIKTIREKTHELGVIQGIVQIYSLCDEEVKIQLTQTIKEKVKEFTQRRYSTEPLLPSTHPLGNEEP